VDSLVMRLSQPFILLLEADSDIENWRRIVAFEACGELAAGSGDASIVATIGEAGLSIAGKLTPESDEMPPVLLVQLLSMPGIGKDLAGLPKGQGVLESVERSNLYDVASVPWLLSYLIRQSNSRPLSRSKVISRIVADSFASVDFPKGGRRMVSEALSRVA